MSSVTEEMKNIVVVHTSADGGANSHKNHTERDYADQGSLVQQTEVRTRVNPQKYFYLHFAELNPLSLTALVTHLRAPGVVIQIFCAG